MCIFKHIHLRLPKGRVYREYKRLNITIKAKFSIRLNIKKKEKKIENKKTIEIMW